MNNTFFGRNSFKKFVEKTKKIKNKLCKWDRRRRSEESVEWIEETTGSLSNIFQA